MARWGSFVQQRERLAGVVSDRSSRGYTFISYALEDGKVARLFAHAHDFPNAELLPPGTSVAFSIGIDSHGRPCALRVLGGDRWE